MEATVRFFPRFNYQSIKGVYFDKYDPALLRLNSVKTFEGFCDSIFGVKEIPKKDSGLYANTVAKVIRYRFHHGYTWYRYGHNYIATLLAPAVNKDLSAIVVPDDILKYKRASCSQQSIIGMKALMDRGFSVRPVGLYHKSVGGHFCYEVWYNGDWHFYDPDRESEENILDSIGRPGIAKLNERKDLLVAGYPQDKPEVVLALYSNYKIGKEGKLPGGNARLFQTMTMVLSYTLWIFLALIYFYIDKRYFSKKE